MKFSALFLMVALVAAGAMAQAQVDKRHHQPQCTPEPISMIGLGIAGLGLLRVRAKKNA